MRARHRAQDTLLRSKHMKSYFLILQVLTVLITSMKATGQAVPTANDFLASTLERAVQILNTTNGREQIDIYVRAAVSSQRHDLVKTCFENQYSWRSTQAAIAALPESSQREALTILMLKSTSHFWPAEELLDGSFPILKPLMDEPFASLIRRLLPGHPLDDDAISTHQKRLKLGADLEMALGQGGSAPATGETSTQAIQSSTPPLPAIQSETPKKSPETKSTTPSEDPTSSTPWSIIVVLIVAAIGLLWLVLKRRS